jgi:hypothetical protein
MALEEVLKHECESGFVVEISENDRDRKEFIKMVVSPRRDEIGSPRVEIKDSRRAGAKQTVNENEDLVMHFW